MKNAASCFPAAIAANRTYVNVPGNGPSYKLSARLHNTKSLTLFIWIIIDPIIRRDPLF